MAVERFSRFTLKVIHNWINVDHHVHKMAWHKDYPLIFVLLITDHSPEPPYNQRTIKTLQYDKYNRLYSNRFHVTHSNVGTYLGYKLHAHTRQGDDGRQR